jgi:phage protein D
MVTAKWHDTDTGESGVETCGSDSPAFEILYPYSTQAEAVAACAAKYKSVGDSSETFSCQPEASYTLVKAFAEGHIQPSGWRSEIDDRTWRIKQIKKSLTPDSGLTIDISCDAGSE